MTLIIIYLIGVLIMFEFRTLQNRHSFEFIVFSSIFYPLIWAVWILLTTLAICADVIYGIGDKIKESKGRKMNGN